MPSYALYMTSYPHFMTTILSIYDITYTIPVTMHPLYIGQDTNYVYDIILSIYGISYGV